MNIKDLIKNNVVKFDFYRNGYAFYTLKYNNNIYSFPVELNDLGNASIYAEMKAITMMRYIRKAIENDTLVRLYEIR